MSVKTEYQSLKDNPTYKSHPCLPITQGSNKVVGILFGLMEIGFGVGQIVYNQVYTDKKDLVFTILGAGVIATGLLTIINTIFDFCLWRKQTSNMTNLVEKLNAKSGLEVNDDSELQTKYQTAIEQLKKANEFRDDLVDLAKQFPDLSDKIKEYKLKRRDLKSGQSSNQSSTISTPLTKPKVKE